jgi:hypothetical protein
MPKFLKLPYFPSMDFALNTLENLTFLSQYGPPLQRYDFLKFIHKNEKLRKIEHLTERHGGALELTSRITYILRVL